MRNPRRSILLVTLLSFGCTVSSPHGAFEEVQPTGAPDVDRSEGGSESATDDGSAQMPIPGTEGGSTGGESSDGTSFAPDLPSCGDGAAGEGEDCDADDVGGATCVSLGWLDGSLACLPDCTFDTSGCTSCGDGFADPHEDCDGDDLAGKDCSAAGFSQGALACAADCTLDAAMCSGPICGFDPAGPGDACPPECTSCSDGRCDIACDDAQACEQAALTCPDGWKCRVHCDGEQACAGASVACDGEHACETWCNGALACEGLSMTCADGPCSISCGAGDSVCTLASVQCGNDACAATCLQQESPTLACGTACACSPC